MLVTIGTQRVNWKGLLRHLSQSQNLGPVFIAQKFGGEK